MLRAAMRLVQRGGVVGVGAAGASGSSCIGVASSAGRRWVATTGGAEQEEGEGEGEGGSGRPRIKVYTKTGDKGKSSLFTGERRAKDDPVFKALGAVDELSAVLSCAREAEYGMAIELSQQIIEIQSRLIDIGSNIATPARSANEARLRRTSFGETHAEQLEAWIDAMDDQLPQLRNFILPSGGMSASFLHLARAVARRAERHVVPLIRAGECEPNVGVYINRLSDYLFQAARVVAMREGKSEMVYKKPKSDD
ncbi:flagellar associated protein [Thecamonas trahens ATCC 50062]|uniref:Corrinoid adenosyltransferase MMAB n=1 Tax=Thecamonas trahens ATCC 50062 TaxID=461836 RepID=A0A0L0D9A3_THETB|nr:flagellar associated protein [Thecamonas trahens ATCC 50062]KNC48924.1 flagellar associated protein [Thecamonas trahens ATCC 50062]|eukprot:XP_013758341.1 flagellar associated protein [Thecamonas trahens ATCC 50062]